MPRKGVPYGGGICSLKERIAELFDLVGEKLHSINGVRGDGQGNLKLKSGDPAVLITGDAAQNEIEIALDNSKLPSAAVSSVNGKTGAVALNAGDIPSDGNSDVQADIDAGKTGIRDCIVDINAEREARQNADAALQTNINAVQSRMGTAERNITALQNVQADYVKKAGAAQTVTSRIMVPTTATGTRDTQIANGTRIQNDLDAYEQMLRTTGNQTAYGMKQIMDLAGVPHMTKASSAYYQWFSVPKATTGIYCLTAAIAARTASFIDLFYIQMNDGVLTKVSKTPMCSAGTNPNISLGVYTTDDSLVFCIHLNAANQYICPIMLGFHGSYGEVVTITMINAFNASVGSDYTEVGV